MVRSPLLPLRLSLILTVSLPLAAAQAQTAPPAAKPPAPAAAPVSPPPPEPESQDITITGEQGKRVEVLPGGKDFISPMGEPFRSKDDLSGAEHWFRQADADGNGRVSLAEFKADAFRFFATLDTDKSDDIGPQELEHYENYVAPEVRVTNSWGNPNQGKVDNDGNYTPPPYPERMGAGKIGYLAIPEPVIYADTNFDRGVDKREWNIAAEQRFKMLDRNGDGLLSRAELPKPGG